jgi:hypothetical protein
MRKHDRWTLWHFTAPDRMIAELHEDLTPPGLGIALEVRLGKAGVAEAVWQLDDGRTLVHAQVGRA